MFEGWCSRCGLTYRDVEDWVARRDHGCDPVGIDHPDVRQTEQAAWRAIALERTG